MSALIFLITLAPLAAALILGRGWQQYSESSATQYSKANAMGLALAWIMLIFGVVLFVASCVVQLIALHSLLEVFQASP